MNYTAIVRILSGLGLVMALALAIGALVAIIAAEWVQLAAFSVGLLFTVVVCSSVLLLTSKPKRRTGPRDGLAVLLLWWILAGAVGAIPYMFEVPPGAVLTVLHESVSSLTTSGHAVIAFDGPDEAWPVSLLVWRALLHVQGAIASLVAAASVFAALNIGGPGIHKTVLFTLPDGNFFDATPRVFLAAGLAVLGTASAVSLMLMISGISAGEALSDAISVATTGLVAPGRASAASLNWLQQAIIVGGLLFSTIGLAFALEARAGRWRAAFRDPEGICLLIVIAMLVLALLLAGHAIWPSLMWTVSHVSTSGMAVGNVDAFLGLPVAVAILPALIGGSALSTAGGLKLARLSLLMSRAQEEFARLGFRDSVVAMSFRGKILPDAAVIGIWVYLVAYVAVLSALFAGFALCGLSFTGALQTAAGTLSNSGALVSDETAHLPNWRHALSVVALITGRLEVIALIPAFITGFWRG